MILEIGRHLGRSIGTHIAFRTNERMSFLPLHPEQMNLREHRATKKSSLWAISWSPWSNWRKFKSSWLAPCKHLPESQMASSGKKLRFTFNVLSDLEPLWQEPPPNSQTCEGRVQHHKIWNRPLYEYLSMRACVHMCVHTCTHACEISPKVTQTSETISVWYLFFPSLPSWFWGKDGLELLICLSPIPKCRDNGCMSSHLAIVGCLTQYTSTILYCGFLSKWFGLIID